MQVMLMYPPVGHGICDYKDLLCWVLKEIAWFFITELLYWITTKLWCIQFFTKPNIIILLLNFTSFNNNEEVWKPYQMWDFKDLLKYTYFLVWGCSEGCIITRRPLPVHMRLFIPWSFLSVWQTTQRMSLVAYTESCGWLNAWEFCSFVLKYLQEKSPSNSCCYFCVTRLQ